MTTVGGVPCPAPTDGARGGVWRRRRVGARRGGASRAAPHRGLVRVLGGRETERWRVVDGARDRPHGRACPVGQRADRRQEARGGVTLALAADTVIGRQRRSARRVHRVHKAETLRMRPGCSCHEKTSPAAAKARRLPLPSASPTGIAGVTRRPLAAAGVIASATPPFLFSVGPVSPGVHRRVAGVYAV
jgi:hypothetical protein